jgi:hypothetical protein
LRFKTFVWLCFPVTRHCGRYSVQLIPFPGTSSGSSTQAHFKAHTQKKVKYFVTQTKPIQSNPHKPIHPPTLQLM